MNPYKFIIPYYSDNLEKFLPDMKKVKEPSKIVKICNKGTFVW